MTRKQSAPRYLYRSRDGVLFGVLRGLSDYTGLSLFWLRVITIILFITTGFLPIIPIYLLAALLMKPEPKYSFVNDVEGEEFYHSMASNRTAALQRLKRKLDGLERRTERMEGAVTGKEYDWERRFREA